MPHLLPVLALTSAWNHKITPESFIVPYHSFSTSVSFIGVTNSLLPPLTATLWWRIFCRHGPDEGMKGKLCLGYCLMDCKLSCSILIQWNIVTIRVSFQRIYHIQRYHIRRFIFLLDQYQTQVWTLATQPSLTRSQIYQVLQILNAAPILCHVVTSNARTFTHNDYV